MQSPFEAADKLPRKVKLFLWGSWGVGKTTLALQFPKPVVIDLDGGTELYGGKYRYDVLRSADIVAIKNAIVWLIQNPGAYDTLVIDPITVYWEALQKFWSDIFLKRNLGTQANKHEFFDLGPKEWNTIKQDFRGLFAKLLELDMNVVVTAREAPKYLNDDFRRGRDGTKFDGEKGIPYLFDTVVHMYRDEQGRYIGDCSKDRTESLPAGPFEVDAAKMLAAFKILKKQNLQKESEKK